MNFNYCNKCVSGWEWSTEMLEENYETHDWGEVQVISAAGQNIECYLYRQEYKQKICKNCKITMHSCCRSKFKYLCWTQDNISCSAAVVRNIIE